ncbi:capsid protein [Juncus maritimus associated virus]|uniref:Capsid protein n=1 Tax=Juncus maritimus associated virus TaxID=2093273 RepID=A0A2I8B2J9_9GEMI|nr:capsid protein [Juncus maritimus associated virus]AUT11865.1 capsid protein [Juncus maritimus associated virus]
MDYSGRKRRYSGPSTPVQIAKRMMTIRKRFNSGSVRRALFQSPYYRPNLMGFRRRSKSIFPDKGYHDDEDHWGDFSSSAGVTNYVSMPYLGQAKNQRHTNKIKIWSISANGALHIKTAGANPDTIIATVFLMWAHNPNGGSNPPAFNDVFTTSTNMDDQHNPSCAKIKHPMLAYYKCLARKHIVLIPYTNYCAGENRALFNINIKFRGRNAKYVEFGESSSGGSYSDIKSGGLFYYVRYYSPDPAARLEGDWNCRVIYYH